MVNLIKDIKMNIWGRDFELPIEYSCHKGENVQNEQIKILESFLKNKKMVDDVKKDVEAYCKEAVIADDENNKKDNIFSYIKPHYLKVSREKTESKVALMCKYRYEPEHGLAIVFLKDGKVEVGIQDIIL